jgi:hypothetical protein
MTKKAMIADRMERAMNAQTPTVTVDDVTVDESKREGTATYPTFATFTVTVTWPENWTKALSVDYRTANGTATAGDDYTLASGRMTFAPGELTQTVKVEIIDDGLVEGGETFSFNLSNPTKSVRIADDQGQATIKDNDPPPPPSTKYHQDDNLTHTTT